MRLGVWDFLARFPGPILAVLWGAGSSVHPALSKTPAKCTATILSVTAS